MRVNKLFIKSPQKSDLFQLQNNFVFQHACMTPLTILSCSLDTIESENSKTERNNSLIAAKEATKRLTALIRSITHQEEVNQSFVVADAVQEVVLLFKRKHGVKINYSCALSTEIKLYGNKLYFQEVLVCLLNNAKEAYSESQEVHISLLVKQVDNKVCIHVVDFAIGMSLLAQKMALMEGVSYKENGLGLGLFFTKKTIEAKFKGEMRINSKLGMGTHIQVMLPIQEPCTQSLLQF